MSFKENIEEQLKKGKIIEFDGSQFDKKVHTDIINAIHKVILEKKGTLKKYELKLKNFSFSKRKDRKEIFIKMLQVAAGKGMEFKGKELVLELKKLYKEANKKIKLFNGKNNDLKLKEKELKEEAEKDHADEEVYVYDLFGEEYLFTEKQIDILESKHKIDGEMDDYELELDEIKLNISKKKEQIISLFKKPKQTEANKASANFDNFKVTQNQPSKPIKKQQKTASGPRNSVSKKP